ncbi:hypothetical protein AB0C47_15960 [Micromonospora taraxaci]|uniref:hypothetical protein n=1 Tax=Micromonospora taraxaci TaxID=1316803 RepID=UPI0033F83FF4
MTGAAVGGANSAGQAALSLTAHGETVDSVVGGTDVRTRMTDRIRGHPRIQIYTNNTVRELAGDVTLTSLVIET